MIDVIESRDDDGGILYAPRISYKNKQGEITSFVTSSRTSWKHKIGAQKNVYLHPDGKGRPKYMHFGLWITAACLLFFVLLVLPIWTKIIDYFRTKKFEKLKLYGNRLETDFVNVERVLGSKSNIRGYIIHVQYHDDDSQTIQTFKSHLLQFDPTDLITQEKITVYTDKGNTFRYVMDLSFLPKHVNRE